MSERFIQCLYENCAPTIKRVKPSNLMTIYKDKHPNWKADFKECVVILRRHGYGLYLLRETERFLVVMIYHLEGLVNCLSQQEQHRFLQREGYPQQKKLSSALATLRRRFQRTACPHEIGLFLGYPMEDVVGFITNRGKNAKLTGVWKVYGDVSSAVQQFTTYQNSRKTVLHQAACGMGLESILST